MEPGAHIESLIRRLQLRQGRRKSELTLCEGRRACQEVIQRAEAAVDAVILRNDVRDFSVPPTLPCYTADAAWFERFAPTMQSQGILVLVHRPAFLTETEPSADPFALVLDRINDPGNLGTIMRTAVAAGLHELWLTKGSTDPFSEKAIRAGMGIQFSLKIRMFDSLRDAVEIAPLIGMTGPVLLTSPHEGENLYTTPDAYARSVIVMGCEAHGLTEKVTPQSRWITIPMPGGAESLNVAQAATLFLFDRIRRLHIPV